MDLDLQSLAVGAAGLTVAGAYLDAKLGISTDLKDLYHAWKANQVNRVAEKSGQGSPWFYFRQVVKRMPENELCIWSRTGSYTWRETYAQACRYAQLLLSSGVKPGEMASLYLYNSPEFLFLSLACWAIGGAPAMINYNLTGDGLVHVLKISGTKVVIVDPDEECRSNIEEVRERIERELGMIAVLLDPQKVDRLPAQAPNENFSALGNVDSMLFLQYTSGSTGYPKAVPFRNRRACTLYGPYVNMTGLHPGPNGDRFYIPMPLYHGTSFVIAVMCLSKGLSIALAPKFSASRFWEDVRKSEATAFVYVGEAARYLVANTPSALDKQHKVRFMWGNGMRPDVWARFVDRFGIKTVAEFFNSSEGMFGLVNVCQGPYKQFAVGHQGAISRFLTRDQFNAVEVDIETGMLCRDPTTGFAKALPWDVGGEILVRCQNESDFIGYWLNADASNKKFERNVFKKGDLYYRTGDALRRTPDGRWLFLDRLGDTFRWKSENVAAAQVSQVLGQYPGVIEANVYGVTVPGHDGRAGCAAIYIDHDTEQNGGLNFADFLAFARANLPKYAVPVFIRLVDSPSLTGNSKQNKVPLRNEGIDTEKIAAEAEKSGKPVDRMMWCPSGVGSAKVTTAEGKEAYVAFGQNDYDNLKKHSAKI